VVEPLEKSRPNPFVAYSGAGLLAAKPSAGLAFAPSFHTMPVGVFQQHQFPIRGGQGQSIKVPAPKSLRLPAGPEAPPQEEYLRVVGVFYDNQGRAAVIVQREGREETYRVGDRFNEKNTNMRWTVQSIGKDQMVLSRQEGGKTITRTVHFIRGGGGTGGGRPGTPGPPAGPGGANQPRQPGTAGPGAGGAQQPGVRRPGGGGGGFPGVPAPGGAPQGGIRRPGGAPAGVK
jgi:hypothetical protein